MPNFGKMTWHEKLFSAVPISGPRNNFLATSGRHAYGARCQVLKATLIKRVLVLFQISREI